MKLRTILILCIWVAIASADILQNPDFELPPSNWNATSAAFFPLNETSIPGWTYDGEVQYVTAGDELSLPRNGHAILLGEDGKINQTFVANGQEVQYLLTFTLARRSNANCTANASLVVSAPDSSAQFSLTHKYGKEAWEVYGHQLGIWGGGESVNLVIESQDIDAEANSTCWPIIDAVMLSTIGSLKQGDAISAGVKSLKFGFRLDVLELLGTESSFLVGLAAGFDLEDFALQLLSFQIQLQEPSPTNVVPPPIPSHEFAYHQSS